MGQILTRMNMSWLGAIDSPDASKTFRKVVYVLAAYYILSSICAPPKPYYKDNGDGPELIEPEGDPFKGFVYNIVNLAFGLYSFVVMIRLRAAVRERYSLPDITPCGDVLEDIACVCCCGCCTVSQLARHTADYEQCDADCCTSTGLPPNSRSIQMVV